MKRSLLFILLPALICGCASSPKSIRTADDFRQNVQNSPELLEIDAELDSLEEKTNALSGQYDELQNGILPHATFDDESEKTDKLEIHINENNVLIVNGKTMSKNDFTIYAGKSLPALCTPSPSISIHKKANYDTAAWVLDTIYRHGCPDVKLE